MPLFYGNDERLAFLYDRRKIRFSGVAGDERGNRRTALERQAYYRTHWRRRQMSDHLPMWLELKIDYGENYLEKRSAQ